MKGNNTMTIKIIFIAATTLLCSVLLMSGASADDISYTTHIRPIFDKQCMKCHGQDSPVYGEFIKDKEGYKAMSRGPNMYSYADLVFFVGWPDTGALMRRLDDGKNTKDGRPGNMYVHLGSSEEERQQNLAVFKTWVGNWMLKKWSAADKEDLDGIKVNY